jgi:hypothetical protein
MRDRRGFIFLPGPWWFWAAFAGTVALFGWMGWDIGSRIENPPRQVDERWF